MLNPAGKLYFKIKNWYNGYHNEPYRVETIDSFTRLYPQMWKRGFYRRLIDSITVPNKSFKFTTITKAISYKQFYDIVTSINNSGYWKLPRHIKCNEQILDGFEYIVEANTSKKYNCVFADDCNDQPAFAKACQQLIKCAGLNNEIRVSFDPVDQDDIKPKLLFKQDQP